MPIRPENRACDWCGTTFVPYLGRRDVRWCSPVCKSRAASAVPRSRPKVCAHCGGLFTPPRSAKQRYCAPACKAAAREAAVRADPERMAHRAAAQKAYSQTPAYRVVQRSAKARRRAAERAGGVSVVEWEAILDRFENRCAYCLSEGLLTMDHVVALSLGGKHEPGNVVPACGPCNSSKGTSDWTERLPCLSAQR